MIRLERGDAPDELTEDFVNQQTALYKREVTAGKSISVWNHKWLKKALLATSHWKCAYCEVSLEKESSYMEVEHFEDKAHNEDKVLKWDNLLPSCKHCNSHKKDHNVIAEPIVNPYADNPHDHLYFKNYMMRGRDEKGKTTIETLGFRDYERKIDSWFRIGKIIETRIDNILERYKKFCESQTTRRRNALFTDLRNLLLECQPNKEYSAVCSTILIENDDLREVRDNMINTHLWADDIEILWQECNRIALLK